MNIINGREVKTEVDLGDGWIGIGDLVGQILVEDIAPTRPASITHDFEWVFVPIEDEWKRLFVNLRREYQKRCLVSLALWHGRGAGAKRWLGGRAAVDTSPNSGEDD